MDYTWHWLDDHWKYEIDLKGWNSPFRFLICIITNPHWLEPNLFIQSWHTHTLTQSQTDESKIPTEFKSSTRLIQVTEGPKHDDRCLTSSPCGASTASGGGDQRRFSHHLLHHGYDPFRDGLEGSPIAGHNCEEK